jgi:hypothetical protein
MKVAGLALYVQNVGKNKQMANKSKNLELVLSLEQQIVVYRILSRTYEDYKDCYNQMEDDDEDKMELELMINLLEEVLDEFHEMRRLEFRTLDKS